MLEVSYGRMGRPNAARVRDINGDRLLQLQLSSYELSIGRVETACAQLLLCIASVSKEPVSST